MNNRLQAFGFALEGIHTFFKETFHAKIHAVAAIAVIGAGIYLRLSKTEWMFVLLSITLVFMTEMLNSSLEYLVDLAQPTHHPLAKKAKDIAAAAVLLAAIFSANIAAFIIIPKII